MDLLATCTRSWNKSLADSEMDMVSLAEGESDGETRVDTDGGTSANVKVAAGEASSDSSGLLVSELAGALCRAKSGG